MSTTRGENKKYSSTNLARFQHAVDVTSAQNPKRWTQLQIFRMYREHVWPMMKHRGLTRTRILMIYSQIPIYHTCPWAIRSKTGAERRVGHLADWSELRKCVDIYADIRHVSDRAGFVVNVHTTTRVDQPSRGTTRIHKSLFDTCKWWTRPIAFKNKRNHSLWNVFSR